MTSNTADISRICVFGWYDWVMFPDNAHTFPDLKMTLGRYLGLTTIIYSALTAKIITGITLLHVDQRFVISLTKRHTVLPLFVCAPSLILEEISLDNQLVTTISPLRI